MTSLSLTLRDIKYYVLKWIKTHPSAAAVIFDRIILVPASGEATMYPKTDAGLDSAGAAVASAEDGIWVPRCTLASDHTLAGAIYHGVLRPLLAGLVTLGSATELHGFKVIRTADDGDALNGIQNQASGLAYLYNCDVTVTQAGAGDACAVAAVNGSGADDGTLYLYGCNLSGTSSGGSGYGIRSTAGKVYMIGGVCHGSTDPGTTS